MKIAFYLMQLSSNLIFNLFFRSYAAMGTEVSQILGFRWYALNDKQYKLTPSNLNIPYYYEGFEEAD